MGTIYVDADACSVKNEVYKVASRHSWSVFVVSNQYIQTPPSKRIVCIRVGQGADVADDWIAERSTAADVVVTNDIPLAARCLENGARVVSQKGHPFTEDSIGQALAGRQLAQDLREMGVMSGGPKPMQPKDRSRFLASLDKMLVALMRNAGG